MGDKNYRILLVEDCKKGMSKIYADFLFSEFNNLHINLVANVADVEHRLETDSFSTILLAPNLPHYDGTSLVHFIKKIAKGIPLVVFLNSIDQQRIDDVKKIGVDKIIYDGNIDIKEISELCQKFGNAIPASSKKENALENNVERVNRFSAIETGSANSISSFDGNKIDSTQEEIKKHKEALQKARKEFEASREAEIKANEEMIRLKEEALTAKKEAEQVRKKIKDLERVNSEQTKIIEEKKKDLNNVSHESVTVKENYGHELDSVREERDNLVLSLENVQNELSNKDTAINHLHNELANLRKDVEHLLSDRNELSIKLGESEDNKRALEVDIQKVLKNLNASKNEVDETLTRVKELEIKVDESVLERDKALENARLAGEYSNKADHERNEALDREKNALEAKLRAENLVGEFTKKYDDSIKMIANLNEVIESLELRCEELEAGQAALIEAEHVGLKREREARENAESELFGVKSALGDLERIEQERAKLEELLKDGQDKENELIREKTRELENSLTNEKNYNLELQEKNRTLKSQLESKTNEISSLTTNNERYESEIVEKSKIIATLESRVLEYKNTLNDLEQQHSNELNDLTDKIEYLEETVAKEEENKVQIEELNSQLKALKEESEKSILEKQEIMESYANKAEAVQDRLTEAEKMLKDCEWKLENETSLKDLALERVMELGAFEEQVGSLEVELASKDNDIQNLKTLVNTLKEENSSLKENEVIIKDRVQLENLEKDMKFDKLSKELDGIKSEYSNFKSSILQEKENITANAQDTQERLREVSEKLKNSQWEVGEIEKERSRLVDRVVELEGEAGLLADLHAEIEELKNLCLKSEKKISFLTDENERLLEKISSYKGMALKINELEEKAALADKVALEIEELSTALKEEQIEHHRLNVEMRKTQEREKHLDELKKSNKELGWELMKARTLIGEYIAKEEEQSILDEGSSNAEVERLKIELKDKEESFNKLIIEKEEFTKEQLNKVAELTELYEKAQTERLELLERLGRQQ